MKPLSSLLEPIRQLDLERFAGLRPAYPSVAVELDRSEMVLVRVRRRRGRAGLEAHASRAVPEQGVGASILRPNLTNPEETARRAREMFEATGTRIGKVSLVLPDNLARVSLMGLPDRPPSRRHLDEMVRFKLKRSVPFRLEDAVISYQVLPSEGKELNLLVALMLRSVVEQYEHLFESVGMRTGLVELSTLALFNLCRSDMARASAGGRDVALLNCARGYFSLLIVRGERLLFFRCKSLTAAEVGPEASESVLNREIATSVSYYQEKLGGQGISATFVRDVTAPPGERNGSFEALGLGTVLPVDPAGRLALTEGFRLDPVIGQRIAPAVGAAAGRID